MSTDAAGRRRGGTAVSTVDVAAATAAVPMTAPPITPDGRYIVVRGRLWRRADPSLDEAKRGMLVHRLMDARRAVGCALRAGNTVALAAARAEVDAAKTGLGERGAVWWDDGAPDLTRRMARTTSYAD